MQNLTRRRFLKATAAAAAATTLKSQPTPVPAWPENGTLIPDTGWHLWIDDQAAWQQDTLYLPEDLDLATLPTNPPTGGWASLTANQIPITLPSTVEQHLWGRYTHRPYTPDEYRYAADDPIPQLGAYFGVSWWHRPIEIPANLQGKRIFLHIRAARLRAEVYLNQQLVGYSILEELPFECDLTRAALPGGQNHLAIRITNPFGRYDWVDGLNAQWGAIKLYRSHGFGGLDRGLTLSAHGPERIVDLWGLNTLHSRHMEACAIVEAGRGTKRVGSVRFEILDPVTGHILGAGRSDLSPEDGSVPDETHTQGLPRQRHSTNIKVLNAKRWDLATPKLYHLRATIEGPYGDAGSRTIPFAFRTFAPEAIGTNAIFRLNGRRIKLYSAISWGFWGLNGLFPTPSLARKEVTQAKKLNLNTLNFHRNLAKEDVLRAGDELGLLRYLEPGAGKLAIGHPPPDPSMPSGQSIAHSVNMEPAVTPADKFAQRYMFAKCVAMVRAFRSHPSVIQYTLQNEIGADLNDPATIAILEAMRAEDPSRCIVLNDGFVAAPRRAAQAWFEPYNPKLHRSDQEPWGGWWNQHQGAGDQWYDDFYRSPKDFTYASPEHKALSEFGEMEGCATPDNHSLLLHQQSQGIDGQSPNKSYDHTDHAEQLAAYDQWLTKWNFRQAFPATEQLWLTLGKKCYDTWQNYLENARISDDLDFAVISGWETTAIENHSGIVDNLRNFKSDPTPITQTLQPIHPVAKQRSLCIALDQPATFDLYLLNDTGAPATGTLTFSAITPTGKLLKLIELPAPPQSPDVFSYLLQESFQTPPLPEEGFYRFRFAISSAPQSTQTKEIWVTGSSLPTNCKATRIAVSGISPALRNQLTQLGCNQLHEFTPGQSYGAIITAGQLTPSTPAQSAGETTGLESTPPPGTFVNGPEQTTKQTGHIDPAILEACRQGTPLLVIPQADTLSEGCAQQLAAAGAFTYHGAVGDFRAPWMGNWYFVRAHPLFAGLPVNQAMGIHYQAHGRQSNGLLVDGPNVEIIVGYSRDHDRRIGAGTFTTRLGRGKLLYHRVPDLHPVLQQRFLANAITWLTTT